MQYSAPGYFARHSNPVMYLSVSTVLPAYRVLCIPAEGVQAPPLPVNGTSQRPAQPHSVQTAEAAGMQGTSNLFWHLCLAHYFWHHFLAYLFWHHFLAFLFWHHFLTYLFRHHFLTYLFWHHLLTYLFCHHFWHIYFGIILASFWARLFGIIFWRHFFGLAYMWRHAYDCVLDRRMQQNPTPCTISLTKKKLTKKIRGNLLSYHFLCVG